MTKQIWRPGNMLYPLPAVMVSCANEAGESDIVTVAWTGTVCTNPAMLYISLRPERHSYHIVRESGEFVVNLTTANLQRSCDWCGVRSGRTYDKWQECHLTKGKASGLSWAPTIEESPVNIECRVTQVIELGSHHMFVAEVVAVQVDDDLLDETGKLDLGRAGLTAYSHGDYLALGKQLGSFGYSVRKKPKAGAGKAPAAHKAQKGQGKPGRGHAGDRPGTRKGAGHTGKTSHKKAQGRTAGSAGRAARRRTR